MSGDVTNGVAAVRSLSDYDHVSSNTRDARMQEPPIIARAEPARQSGSSEPAHGIVPTGADPAGSSPPTSRTPSSGAHSDPIELAGQWQNAATVHPGRSFRSLASITAELKSARTARGVALEAVAERSRIPLTMLRELEAGDVRNWPTARYGRSQLVRYARAIGVDAERVVAAVAPFLELHAVSSALDAFAADATAPELPPAIRSRLRPPSSTTRIIGAASMPPDRARSQPGTRCSTPRPPRQPQNRLPPGLTGPSAVPQLFRRP